MGLARKIKSIATPARAGIEFYNEISIWRVPVMSLLRVV